jgi:hypothetical protein
MVDSMGIYTHLLSGSQILTNRFWYSTAVFEKPKNCGIFLPGGSFMKTVDYF